MICNWFTFTTEAMNRKTNYIAEHIVNNTVWNRVSWFIGGPQYSRIPQMRYKLCLYTMNAIQIWFPALTWISIAIIKLHSTLFSMKEYMYMLNHKSFTTMFTFQWKSRHISYTHCSLFWFEMKQKVKQFKYWIL